MSRNRQQRKGWVEFVSARCDAGSFRSIATVDFLLVPAYPLISDFSVGFVIEIGNREDTERGAYSRSIGAMGMRWAHTVQIMRK